MTTYNTEDYKINPRLWKEKYKEPCFFFCPMDDSSGIFIEINQGIVKTGHYISSSSSHSLIKNADFYIHYSKQFDNDDLAITHAIKDLGYTFLEIALSLEFHKK